MFRVSWSVAAAAMVAGGLWSTAAVSRAGCADAPPSADRSVVIDVEAPTGAEVWFDDAKTNSTGAMRRFVTPPLAAGREFNYTIRVRWEAASRPVERTQRLTVHAGDRITLDYTGTNGAIAPAAFEVERPAGSEMRRSFYPPAATTAAPAAVEFRPGSSAPPRYYEPGPPAGPPGSNDPLSTGVGNG
jgi:uncharacterized protein (TIGR03000 family)